MKDWLGNFTEEVKHLRKNQQQMLKIKNTIAKLKTNFDTLIVRLDTAQERINGLER